MPPSPLAPLQLKKAGSASTLLSSEGGIEGVRISSSVGGSSRACGGLSTLLPGHGFLCPTRKPTRAPPLRSPIRLVLAYLVIGMIPGGKDGRDGAVPPPRLPVPPRSNPHPQDPPPDDVHARDIAKRMGIDVQKLDGCFLLDFGICFEGIFDETPRMPLPPPPRDAPPSPPQDRPTSSRATASASLSVGMRYSTDVGAGGSSGRGVGMGRTRSLEARRRSSHTWGSSSVGVVDRVVDDASNRGAGAHAARDGHASAIGGVEGQCAQHRDHTRHAAAAAPALTVPPARKKKPSPLAVLLSTTPSPVGAAATTMSPWLPLSRCSSSAASTPSHLPPYHNSRSSESCSTISSGFLRDVRMIIRESAACFLAACLDIGVQRQRQTLDTTPAADLSKNPRGRASMFMKDGFQEAAEAVLTFKADRDPLVRRMVMAMIPPLATSNKHLSTGHGSSDDYFQTAVVSALLGVLQDPASSGHHHTVIEAVMSTLQDAGLEIMPAFAVVTRAPVPRLQELHLQQLAILIGIIKQHVRDRAAEVLGLVTELWDNSTLQAPIVALIEFADDPAVAVEGFVFEGELSNKRMNTQMRYSTSSRCLVRIHIEEYFCLVIPIIVKSAEKTQWPWRFNPAVSVVLVRTVQVVSVIRRILDLAKFMEHEEKPRLGRWQEALVVYDEKAELGSGVHRNPNWTALLHQDGPFLFFFLLSELYCQAAGNSVHTGVRTG
ncbi:hypothetical protein C8J57DRAFT_1470270 [Mycena rebaudengoi]|nr:hypothetical protein C8J57DRAFT_1470270 [Mycena rebaudengoi]